MALCQCSECRLQSMALCQNSVFCYSRWRCVRILCSVTVDGVVSEFCVLLQSMALCQNSLFCYSRWRCVRILCSVTVDGVVSEFCVLLQSMALCQNSVFCYSRWRCVRILCSVTVDGVVSEFCVLLQSMALCQNSVFCYSRWRCVRILCSVTVDGVVSVFIHKVQGEEIAGLVDSGVTVTMDISVGRQLSVYNAALNETSDAGRRVRLSALGFASLSIVMVLVCVLGVLLVYAIRRARYVRTKPSMNVVGAHLGSSVH